MTTSMEKRKREIIEKTEDGKKERECENCDEKKWVQIKIN